MNDKREIMEKYKQNVMYTKNKNTKKPQLTKATSSF